MKKTLLVAAAALVIVIAGVAVYLYNSIDSIVKNAIEHAGTETTGTKVSVGSVDISLRSGKGTIRNLRVKNPEGFSNANAVELGEITLDLEVGSLNRDPIVIEEILVKAPEVNAEVDEKYVTNVGVIRDHVQKYQAAAQKPSSGKQDAGFEKHFVIRSLVIEKGVVRGDATRVGSEKKEFDLPPIKLTNVGGSRGERPDALGKSISGALFAQITKAVSDELKKSATDKATETVKDKIEGILK